MWFGQQRIAALYRRCSLKLAIQFLNQQFVQRLWIRLALTGLHDLTDEEAQHLAALGLVRCAITFYLCSIVGQHFINHFFQRAGI